MNTRLTLRTIPLAAGLLWCGTLLAQFQLQPLWSVAAGVRPYLTTGNTERGMAYNPATGHVILVSRAGGLNIPILDGTTGSDLGFLDTTGIPTSGAGIFSINMVGVADDGAIYVGNLSTDLVNPAFRLYRWENESAAPVQVFSGNPNPLSLDRWGDTMAVRGAGSDTQVLISSRNGTSAAVLVPMPVGADFQAVPILTDAAGGDMGLGLAFGEGNTFWATASGRTLRQIAVDASGAPPLPGTTVGNFGEAEGVPLSINFVGTAPDDALLGGMLGALQVVDGADLFHLYAINAWGTPVLMDTETLTADNPNVNGTGSIAFGGGKAFVLDSNNGIHAYDVIPEPATWALGLLGAFAFLGLRRRS